MNITIWNEFYHEKVKDDVKKLYPDGIHGYIKTFLEDENTNVRLASLDDPDCGLTQEVLDDTDVLLWWGHARHNLVPDEVAERVKNAVLKGMGFIPLHSSHHSKPFRALMGTTGNLSWSDDSKERIWCIKPGHPICEGIPQHFELPKEEMYGEPFDIPNPDDVLFMSWFESGYVFRSGCTFTRGRGRIFYFQPGHETNPVYHNEIVQKIIKNAVKWVAPHEKAQELICPKVENLEK